MRIDLLVGVILLAWESMMGVGAQQPTLSLDDRDVLETVFEQIQHLAPYVDKRRPVSLPIKVVDQARPDLPSQADRFRNGLADLLCGESASRAQETQGRPPGVAPSGWLGRC